MFGASTRHVRHATLWSLFLLLISPSALSQTVTPSNSTGDLLPVDTSPRFLLNGTQTKNLPSVRLAPLTDDAASISRTHFLQFDLTGKLIHVDSLNLRSITEDSFAFVSCDDVPTSYSGYVTPSTLVSYIFAGAGDSMVLPKAIIFYSQYAQHCNFTAGDSQLRVDEIYTTIDPMIAPSIVKLQLSPSSSGTSAIVADLNSYTNSSNWGSNGNNGILGPSPTTAVAMIILYAITGIITALFIVIIITGAVRAHRHPERYGPRARVAGMRGAQSRARGIGRAMLETLPLVKFGDSNNAGTATKQTPDPDIEMNTSPVTTNAKAQSELTDAAAAEAKGSSGSDDKTSKGPPMQQPQEATGDVNNDIVATGPAAAGERKPDGTTEDGSLGCSICTEDFNKDDEVRVLPCNHKFHPECVDPWLLNVSGTCPLCRIDLRGEGAEDGGAPPDSLAADGSDIAPPLDGRFRTLSTGDFGPERRDSMPSFIHMRNASSREERIAALRRLRAANRNHASAAGEVEQRRGLTSRLRDRFHIRTTRAVEQSIIASNAHTAERRASEAGGRNNSVMGPFPGPGMSGAAALSALPTPGPAVRGNTELRPLRDVYRFGRRNSANPPPPTTEETR